MLIDNLKSLIKINGPITIAEFMQEALFNPNYGYYQKKVPIGKEGDFTTAPEVSQVFGELIALYLLNLASNSTKPIALVEMGAGRGNLFKDLLRTINGLSDKNIKEAKDFLARSSLNIIEISPALQKKQEENLCQVTGKVNWYQTFQDFLSSNENNEREIYFIANELFDCFPINQFIKTEQGWCEKTVGNKDEELAFFIEKFDPIKNRLVEKLIGNQVPPKVKERAKERAKEQDVIFEHSFSAVNFMQELSQAISKHGGIGIIIDYGYLENKFSNTLQALKNHEFYDCLKTPGEADLTSLVNFSLLEEIANEQNLNSSLVSQSQFLIGLGIEERRKTLLIGKTDEEKVQINSQIDRLIDKEQMGELFRSLIIWV